VFACCCCNLQESLAKLQAENERLRRDNERFVRLIDSGEWGRGRVAELVSAGEVMRGERDALLKLIGSLRREFEAVAAAKGCQEDELRLLKEKMTVGVSDGWQCQQIRNDVIN
jgi:predicted hydrolase (HD superfamily)